MGEKLIEVLSEMIDVQKKQRMEDPYMRGMANGMIFARSIFDKKEPVYVEPIGCDTKNQQAMELQSAIDYFEAEIPQWSESAKLQYEGMIRALITAATEAARLRSEVNSLTEIIKRCLGDYRGLRLKFIEYGFIRSAADAKETIDYLEDAIAPPKSTAQAEMKKSNE